MDVTDDRVDDAIQRAAAWIESKRNPEGHWETGGNRTANNWAGDSALAVLALLYAGRDPRDEGMSRALDWLAAQPLVGTYTCATRAHALALVPGKKYRQRLEEDLDWLLKSASPRGSPYPGAYDYVQVPPGRKMTVWDNSVTQFGNLGVWMAADAGLPVPEWYWEVAGQHWMEAQNADGGWDYGLRGKTASSGSMTAAGLASLFVVLDQRYADHPKDAVGLLTAIARGLEWLGREYAPENPHGSSQWHYYYLYGLERVGRASGHKYFRNKDWFRSGAAFLLAQQKPDGSWPSSGELMSSLRNTAFGLMVLSHGRAPLLMNKLQHGPDWDNRLRDVANLTRFAEHAFERLLNWQIVRLDASLDDLLEAPVLYMYGELKWTFNDVEVQKVREYGQRGGLLFAVAGRGSDEFRATVEDLARRAFPEYPLRPLTSEHPLLNGQVQYPIDDPPAMFEVHNGVRTLLLFCARDLALAWNKYATHGELARDVQLGANVYLYATDKTTLRSRLQTPTIPLRKITPQRTIRLARIKYAGRWDPEPHGWTRMAAYMNNETATRLLVTSGVTFDAEELKDFKVAHLTGSAAFELTADEERGLRQFLSAGGTLLADAAGGGPEFTQALETQLAKAMRGEPRVLEPDSIILTGAGLSEATHLGGVSYRRAARSAAQGRPLPRLMVFSSSRRAAVIYSPLDLSTGLLGTPVYGVQGYEPSSALRIMRNLLLYADLPTAEKAQQGREE